jgi:hypothetical protein
MRWRLIVLAGLAVALAAGCAFCTTTAVDLYFRAQQIYGNLQEQAPTAAQEAESFRLYQHSYGLQLLMTPLAAGSLICVLAVLAVLGRRWQVREAAASSIRAASPG